MRLPGRYAVLARLYSAAWTLALPFLRRNRRLADGFALRKAPPGWARPCDIWIQAASAGEAYLAVELLPHLQAGAAALGLGRPLRLLLTSMTRQGLDILESAAREFEPDAAANSGPYPLDIQTNFFPFDRPGLMRGALAQARPRAVLLLETELWPGLLLECARQAVPVAVLNGRMSEKSLSGYRRFSGLWRHIAPRRVAAISEADAARFDAVFGAGRAIVAPNIKFDRLVPALPAETGAISAGAAPDVCAAESASVSPIAALLPAGPRVLFASTREQEEADLLAVLQHVSAAAPQATLILAPRHMHRITAWQEAFERAGLPYSLRSGLNAPAQRPGIFLWDAMGELNALYAASDAAFVGGSLAPLGGQNYLEALACGLKPFVGPHLKNFAWVGPELAQEGLLRVVPDGPALEKALVDELTLLQTDPEQSEAERRATAESFGHWLSSHTGGSATCAKLALQTAFPA